MQVLKTLNQGPNIQLFERKTGKICNKDTRKEIITYKICTLLRIQT